MNQKKTGHPSVYVIAGPNGAGKTTFAREFLPTYADCRNFVNADLIAQGVSPFSPETAAIKAGKLMLKEIESFAERRLDFGLETTLSGLTHLNLVRRLKRRHYRVNIFYLWIPTAEAALSRVRERVSRGGHDIAEPVVRRRFDRSIHNFLNLYRKVADMWILFDNSGETPAAIARENGEALRIVDEVSYNRVIGRYRQK